MRRKEDNPFEINMETKDFNLLFSLTSTDRYCMLTAVAESHRYDFRVVRLAEAIEAVAMAQADVHYSRRSYDTS